MKKQLTNKEQLFVAEYLIDLDVERAALAAGFSKTMARTKAYQWVCNGKQKPHVYEAVKKALLRQEIRIERSADEVIKRLWKFSDIDEEKYDAEKSSNTKATELLAKHYKLITDKFLVGFDESALAVILSNLPPEYSEAVKRALLSKK